MKYKTSSFEIQTSLNPVPTWAWRRSLCINHLMPSTLCNDPALAMQHKTKRWEKALSYVCMWLSKSTYCNNMQDKAFSPCLCNRVEKRTKQQLLGARSLYVLNLKCLFQKCDCFFASVFGNRRTNLGSTNLEDGLELGTIREGMGSGHHLDDETSEGPNICFPGV